MNALLAFAWAISETVVERLGWVLLHSLWQFALVALLAQVAVRALQRNSAAARYGVLVVAMVVSVGLPVATWTLQPGDASDRSANRGPSVPGQEEFGLISSATGASPRADRPTLATDPTVEFPDPDVAASEALPAARADVQRAPSWSERATSVLRPWLAWLVTGWSLGVVLCALRPLLGWQTLRRLRRVGVSPAPDDVLAAMLRVSTRLGLRGAAQVLQSSLAHVPVVVGYLRPVILLPVSLVTSIPAGQLDAILAHELAHVRRHDFVVNLLQTLVETLFFYHPAVWWLSRRIRVEREHCCDDLVVSLLGNRVEYGRALLAIEQLRGQNLVLALGAADGSLLSRVRRIVGIGVDSEGSQIASIQQRHCGSVLCLFAACALLGATALQFGRDAAADPSHGISANIAADPTVENAPREETGEPQYPENDAEKAVATLVRRTDGAATRPFERDTSAVPEPETIAADSETRRGLDRMRDASRAARAGLHSAIGTGTFEHWRQRLGDKEPMQMAKGKIRVYYDRGKYHIALTHEKMLVWIRDLPRGVFPSRRPGERDVYRDEMGEIVEVPERIGDAKPERAVIVHDGKTTESFERSARIRPLGYKFRNFNDLQMAGATFNLGLRDPVLLGPAYLDIEAVIKNIGAESIAISRLANTGSRGTYRFKDAPKGRAEFDAAPEVGFNVIAERAYNDDNDPPAQVVEATWKRIDGQWVVTRLSFELGVKGKQDYHKDVIDYETFQVNPWVDPAAFTRDAMMNDDWKPGEANNGEDSPAQRDSDATDGTNKSGVQGASNAGQAAEKHQSATYLQKKLSAKIPDALWGKARDGLRLAVVVRDVNNTEWNDLPAETRIPQSIKVQPGDEVRCQLVVDNVSDHDIDISAYTYTEIGRSIEVRNRTGAKADVQSIPLLIPASPTFWRLRPGERFLLQMPAIHFVDMQRDQGIGYFVQTAPGEYTLRCDYTFGDNNEKAGGPISDKSEWTGTLTTGALKVTVSDPSRSDEQVLQNQPGDDNFGPQPAAEAIAANGEIVGRLLDAVTGQPVEGATIACGAIINDSGKGGGANAVTDARGRYRLPVPSPGIYNVWLKNFDKDPSMTAAADDGILVESGKAATSQLRLVTGRKVAGKVVDSDGKPFENLTLSCYSAARPHSGGVQSSKSKSDGSFEFSLPPGRAYVYVSEPVKQTRDNPFGTGRSAHAHLQVPATGNVSPLKLTLQKTESKFGDSEWLNRSTPGTQIVRREGNQDVTGTVVDEAGTPIAGARVFREDGPIVVTDDKGEFRMETMKGTQFVMHAFAPGCHVWFGTPTSGDVLRIVLEPKRPLPPGRAEPKTTGTPPRIRQRTAILVDGMTDTPLQGITVQARGAKEDEKEPRLMSFKSDAGGRIEVPLRNEKGEVRSRDVQAVFVPREVTLPETGEAREIMIRAVPHVTVEFEWIDRRTKKGPVSFYGEFTVTGRVPREGTSPASWRGETEKIERDGREVLMMKIPTSLTSATLQLPADSVVTASYEDDRTQSGPGQVKLGDVTIKRRRMIYGDEPKPAQPTASPLTPTENVDKSN